MSSMLHSENLNHEGNGPTSTMLRRKRSDLKEKDLVCLPSDNVIEFCIIRKDRYSQAALHHLKHSNTYQTVPRMTAKTIESKVNLVWKNFCSRNKFPPFVIKRFIASNTDLAKFYHLIKTHKTGPGIKIRPIVSNINGPSHGYFQEPSSPS